MSPPVHQLLEEYLQGGGAALVGYADLSELPPRPRRGLPRAVSFAVAIEPRAVAGISQGPTAAYAGEYTRINQLLQLLADQGAALLQRQGFLAVPGAATQVAVGPELLASELPHKTVATLAGQGWIGRCALLITPEFGSALRFNTILTDAPLPVGEPVTESRCGDCEECVRACPAGAVLGPLWRRGIERAEFFDAFACRAKALELSRRIGFDRTICGICITVCPFTRRHLQRSVAG